MYLQRAFRWANVLLVFLTFFAYLSPYLHPATFWPFAMLGLLYPVLLVLNLLFILFWLLQLKRYVFLSLGTLLLGWSHLTAFVGLHFGSPPPADTAQASIRVLSYNVLGFRHSKNSTKASGHYWSEKELLDFYADYEPDIWCIQEFSLSVKRARKFSDLIRKQTPLRYAYFEPQKGLALFSRYPLSSLKMDYFGKRNHSNGYLMADIEYQGQKIRIFNIHLQSNAVSRIADEVARNGQLQEKKTWRQVKGIIGGYRRTTVVRSEQAHKIWSRVEESPYPVILSGDLNDVPLSYVYRQFSGALLDGFRQRGRGLGTTFLGSLPMLRIDYIFSSPELVPLEYRVLPVVRSDHYPVLGTFQIGR